MILSDEEVEARIESPKNLCRVIEKRKQGRSQGATDVPESVRDLIAITANKSKGTHQEVADVFNIGRSAVSKYSKGLVGDRLDRDLQSVAKQSRSDREEEAHQSALDVLMTTMKQIQPKLLDPDNKLKDLAIVASSMSKVANNMRNVDKEEKTINNTQVILFAPPNKKLNQYDFVET